MGWGAVSTGKKRGRIVSYKCKRFDIRELVSRPVFQHYGEATCWYFFDPRLLETIDTIATEFGVTYINTWIFNNMQPFDLRGLRHTILDLPRLRACEIDPLIGLHPYGMATDTHFKSAKVEDVRQHILKNPKLFPHIKGMNSKPGYLHIDTRNSDKLIRW